MSTADEPDRPPSPERTGARSRIVIAAVALGVVVFVITFMVLVSQCGGDDDSQIYGAPDAVSVSSAME
jgi:hypothetical protein